MGGDSAAGCMEPSRTKPGLETVYDPILVHRGLCPASWRVCICPELPGCGGGLGLSASASCSVAWAAGPRPGALLVGAGIALVWLVVYGAVFVSPAQAMENRTVQLEAVVTRWPERTDYGARVILQAGEGEGRKVPALLYGDSSLSDLRPGDKLSCVAYCTPADASRGEDSLYYASQGIHLMPRHTVTSPLPGGGHPVPLCPDDSGREDQTDHADRCIPP